MTSISLYPLLQSLLFTSWRTEQFGPSATTGATETIGTLDTIHAIRAIRTYGGVAFPLHTSIASLS